MSLLTIVIFGTLVNFSMFIVSFVRRFRIGGGNGSIKDEVIRLTINRAMRLELILFLCQSIRLLFLFRNPDAAHRLMPERAILTGLLILVSIWDLSDRQRITGKLDDLYR